MREERKEGGGEEGRKEGHHKTMGTCATWKTLRKFVAFFHSLFASSSTATRGIQP